MRRQTQHIRRLQVLRHRQERRDEGSLDRERLIGDSAARLALVVLISGVFGCAAQAPQPTPPPQPPQALTEATCQARTCTIKIDASACESGGHPAVDIGRIRVKGNKNVKLVWEVTHARYDLRLGRSLLLKDPRGDPTGQFSGKFLLGPNGDPDPALKRGKKMQWLDANIVVDNNEYPYKVILFDAADNTCELDPVIVNDG